MYPDQNFQQQNFLWKYQPGYDLQAYVEFAHDKDGSVLMDTVQGENGEELRPIITRTISKWRLSPADLEHVNKYPYIYLDIRGHQPPVALIAGAMFEGENAEEPGPDVLPSEAVMGFLSWLTTREEPVTFSAKHDSAKAVRLYAEYIDAQGWPDCRPMFPDMLKPMPAEPAAPKNFGCCDIVPGDMVLPPCPE